VPGVRPVVLGALLVAAQRGGLRRLGEMNHSSDPSQFLDHEPPAGRRLQRHLEPRSVEALKEPANPGAVRRRDPRSGDLPGRGVDPLARDLRSMLICSD
jgi:hypothetical protein